MFWKIIILIWVFLLYSSVQLVCDILILSDIQVYRLQICLRLSDIAFFASITLDYNINTNQFQSQQQNILLKIEKVMGNYMNQGIIKADIYEDGGYDCYRQIPLMQHIIFCLVGSLVYSFFIYKLHHKTSSLRDKKVVMKSSLLEKAIAFSSMIAFALTFYYKLKTHKGMFIFNPCHISLLVMTLLLVVPSTQFAKKIYTYWTAWIVGAYMALLVPHLQGISLSEIILYYYEHLLLVPIGPIILQRRYGYLKPNLLNQMASFASLTLYQLLILVPLSRLSYTNLNFTLCHSHADILYKYVGYYYFPMAMIHLNLFSYICRWITYFTVLIYCKIETIFSDSLRKSRNVQKIK